MQFYSNRIWHERLLPRGHSFVYPGMSISILVDDWSAEVSKLKDLSKGLFTLSEKDYLNCNMGSPVKELAKILEENQVASSRVLGKSIHLYTMPRFLGRAFNPVSFWMIVGDSGLEGCLAEVRNTFKQRHYYFLNLTQMKSGLFETTAQKEFHVSPFMKVEGSYSFRFEWCPIRNSLVRASIDLEDKNQQKLLKTSIEYASVANLSWQTGLKYGLQVCLVLPRIHWQALRLYLKNMKFYPLPKSRKGEFTNG